MSVNDNVKCSRWNVTGGLTAGVLARCRKRCFKIIYRSPYASHETATFSHIVKYWYRITCQSIRKHNVYINIRLQSMKRRGTFERIQCQDGVVLAVLSIDHTYAMPTHTNYRWLCACTVNTLPIYYSYIRKGWFKQAFRKTCKQIHVSR